MNPLQYYLSFILCFTCISVNGQRNVHPFNPDGSRYDVDTTQVKTIKQYIKFSGQKYLGSDLLTDQHQTLILYKPLSYQPLVVFAKDSASVIGALKFLNKSKYQQSYNMSSDFESMLELGYTKNDILELLGEPQNEAKIDEVYTILSYPGFSIQCINSSSPEYATIDKLTRYDFSGAKKSGLGIADFHINLAGSDNDYVTGFRGSFTNTSTKKIKYLYITVRAENAVDDLAGIKTTKAIGPIAYNEVGSYSFENLFFSRIIESVRITSIKIQYFDGTIKLITGAVLKSSFVEK